MCAKQPHLSHLTSESGNDTIVSNAGYGPSRGCTDGQKGEKPYNFEQERGSIAPYITGNDECLLPKRVSKESNASSNSLSNNGLNCVSNGLSNGLSDRLSGRLSNSVLNSVSNHCTGVDMNSENFVAQRTSVVDGVESNVK